MSTYRREELCIVPIRIFARAKVALAGAVFKNLCTVIELPLGTHSA